MDDMLFICNTILVGIVGAILGSFFNVVGLRVPKKQSIVHPPSCCSHCQRRLSARDLVPVFSYVVLRGKCRSCGVNISPLYPCVELLTALLFAFTYYIIGWSPELIVALLFLSLLIIITVSDLVYMLIPNKILLFFLPILFIGRLISPLTPWWDSIIGAIIGFLMLLSIAFFSKGGMGGGDVKLFFLIGLVLGSISTLLTLFLASFLGLLFGIISIVQNKYKKKTPIPFGPFIAIAAIVVYFYGASILQWYGSII